MSQNTMQNGKAFEYACLTALNDKFSAYQNVNVIDSAQLRTARACYEALSLKARRDMCLAAEAMRRVIVRLEPKLENFRQDDVLTLALQSDQRGQAGDVRDVLCMRIGENWEIGISCKHNHSAVKHSRLALDLDFGKKWVGCPCSSVYFAEVNPVFHSLEKSARAHSQRMLWSDLEDKERDVYIPVLNAFIKEIKRIDEELNGQFAPRLVHYLLGEKDFYKVISDDGNRSTRIEAYNLSGTLGESSNGVKSLYGRKKLSLPTRMIEVRYKDGSRNTVELTCDRGWQFSFRIHNASSRIEPSLKFDIQLVSQLSSHASVNIDEPWCSCPEKHGVILESVQFALRFREYLPVYSLRAACGVLGRGDVVEPIGWMRMEGVGRLDNSMVVVQAAGRSMEPIIHNGDFCVVRKLGAVDYNNRIVLVQRNDGAADPEDGGAYLLKRFVKNGKEVVLRSLNREYADIRVADDGDVKVIAYLHKVVR